MPLPTLNWRRLAPVTLAANTVNDALNAIYTAGTAATYADGSARTPGVDCAWTWSLDNTNAIQPGATTAVWATPPTSFPGVTNPGTVLPQAIIWAGSTTAPGATTPMYTDARTANMVYVAQCLNPGAYSNWNSATPFTSGQFSNYSNAMVLPASAVWGQMQMYESQEAVVVQFWRGAANVGTSVSVAGAYIDPQTSSTLVAMSDGRMYGLMSSGANNYNAALFLSAVSDTFIYETFTAGNAHAGVWCANGAIFGYARRFGTFTPSTATVSTSGAIALLPLYATIATQAGSVVDSAARFREMFIVRDLLASQRIQVGGVDYAYALGANWQTTAADAVALTV